MTEFGTWIDDRNLLPTMEGLGVICGYSFDESDWLAVKHGLKSVDESKNIWFDYPLIGKFRIDVSLTLEIGSSNYSIKVNCEQDISEQVRLVEFYNQCYLVTEF